jgi:hypothetical protein
MRRQKLMNKYASLQNSNKPEGKGRKYNAKVATTSCPVPFLKKKVR